MTSGVLIYVPLGETERVVSPARTHSYAEALGVAAFFVWILSSADDITP